MFQVKSKMDYVIIKPANWGSIVNCPLKLGYFNMFLHRNYREYGTYEGTLMRINNVSAKLLINHERKLWWFRIIGDTAPEPPILDIEGGCTVEMLLEDDGLDEVDTLSYDGDDEFTSDH